MMDLLPTYVPAVFILVTALSVLMLYFATQKSKMVLGLVVALATLHALLAYNGFYLITDTIPPRLLLILLPPVFLIVLAFTTKSGKKMLDSIDLTTYTYLHTLRVPVEIVLLWLFTYSLIPESMTFEGRNFDIVSGLTAPFIAFYGYKRKKINRTAMLTWNIICLLLVLQVVITGILSAPSVFQQLSLDQPNSGILYFPFIWLPSIVVPIVIFGHLVAIRDYFKGH